MGDDAGGEWSSMRREIVYEESRAILDTQQTAVNDMDDKSMRTVRITVILIVGVLSAGLIGQFDFNSAWLVVSGVLFFVSIAAGLGTYDASELIVGPNQEYRTQLIEGEFPERGWEADFLGEMSDWIEQNEPTVRRNALAVAISQFSLAGAILSLSLAILF